MAQTREILLHGHRLCYRAGGRGPLLVLVHGITNSSASWEPVLAQLATSGRRSSATRSAAGSRCRWPTSSPSASSGSCSSPAAASAAR